MRLRLRSRWVGGAGWLGCGVTRRDLVYGYCSWFEGMLWLCMPQALGGRVCDFVMAISEAGLARLFGKYPDGMEFGFC